MRGLAVVPLAWVLASAVWADLPELESIPLPALRITGQAARAHTQGLEVVDGQYYVTARREDVRPRQALLLRTGPGRSDWDAWDITPVGTDGSGATLDHAGGLQSDGKRLWIPVAESRRGGRTLIRVLPFAGLVPGVPPRFEREIPVEDHLGALAVSARWGLVLGASWDTERVYAWDLEGRRLRELSAGELASRGLGRAAGPPARAGLAVQDWKFVETRLLAAGLLGDEAPRSRLLVFEALLEPTFRSRSVPLPVLPRTELAREAMAIVAGWACFIPEDLGPSNRLWRLRLDPPP